MHTMFLSLDVSIKMAWLVAYLFFCLSSDASTAQTAHVRSVLKRWRSKGALAVVTRKANITALTGVGPSQLRVWWSGILQKAAVRKWRPLNLKAEGNNQAVRHRPNSRDSRSTGCGHRCALLGAVPTIACELRQARLDERRR